ncbi:unnamed protein product [Camellia sinensis]
MLGKLFASPSLTFDSGTCFCFSSLEIYNRPQLIVEAQAEAKGEGEKIDCQSKCEYRCSEASRHKICMRACRTCCTKCNCVPPGTVDNEEMCPCYAKMTTHGGRHKCP